MIYDFRVIETGVTAEVNLITKSQCGKAATKRQKRFSYKEDIECCARPVQVVQAVRAEKGSLNALIVWNIPERRAGLRGETELSRQFANLGLGQLSSAAHQRGS